MFFPTNEILCGIASCMDVFNSFVLSSYTYIITYIISKNVRSFCPTTPCSTLQSVSNLTSPLHILWGFNVVSECLEELRGLRLVHDPPVATHFDSTEATHRQRSQRAGEKKTGQSTWIRICKGLASQHGYAFAKDLQVNMDMHLQRTCKSTGLQMDNATSANNNKTKAHFMAVRLRTPPVSGHLSICGTPPPTACTYIHERKVVKHTTNGMRQRRTASYR